MSDKKIVRYSHVFGSIQVGRSATVVPVDYPAGYPVTNGQPAWTSAVVRYDEATEEFETLNTLYVPA